MSFKRNVALIIVLGFVSASITAIINLRKAPEPDPVPVEKIVVVPTVEIKAPHVFGLKIVTEINHETSDALDQALAITGPGDELDITINSGGGQVFAGVHMMEALLNTNRNVVCYVNDGMAASAAAMILMGCQHKVVAPQAHILFHLPYMIDKEGEMVRNPMISEWTVLLMNSTSCLKNFMNEPDYDRFLMGADITYTGVEFNQHLLKACRVSPQSIEKSLKNV